MRAGWLRQKGLISLFGISQSYRAVLVVAIINILFLLIRKRDVGNLPCPSLAGPSQGRVAVDLSQRSWAELEARLGQLRLQPGGGYSPPHCRARDRGRELGSV